MQIIAFKTSQICLHMSVAFIVAYVFTGSLAVGGVAAVVEPICNVTLMPLHDKLWEYLRHRRQMKAPATSVDTSLATASTVA